MSINIGNFGQLPDEEVSKLVAILVKINLKTFQNVTLIHNKFFIFKCGTLSKFGLRTWCINSNKYMYLFW